MKIKISLEDLSLLHIQYLDSVLFSQNQKVWWFWLWIIFSFLTVIFLPFNILINSTIFLILIAVYYEVLERLSLRSIKKVFQKYSNFLKEAIRNKSIVDEYIQILDDEITQDIRIEWVDSNTLKSIENSIKIIEINIRNYIELLIKIEKESKKDELSLFPWFTKYMQSIIVSEKERIVNYVNLFSEKLNIWTLHHQSELQELEKSIENQANQTQNSDWKVALEAQKVRLQSYIESINNLVK